MNRIVDLTLTLEAGMRGVSFEQARSLESDGWNARNLHLYSHCGTHMDAQTHFGAGDETIDRIPLERCMGSVWRVPLADVKPSMLITLAHLDSYADRVRPEEGLLLWTNWSHHARKCSLYRDQLPRISTGLAHWCVRKKIKLLGVEPPSVANVNDRAELTEVHKILLDGGVTIVEGLCNLDQLSQEKCFFMALPLKIREGDGAPCRALAVEGGSPWD